MRRNFMSILRTRSFAVLAGVFLVGICLAQEKKIKRSDLPPAVEKTAAEVSKGATIKGFSEETEKGKTTYEVEMIVNGHSKDVEVDANGAILVIEEQVAIDSLSDNVKAGLGARAAGRKILKVESLTKNGKLVAYEAKVQSASGKKSEIQVGPDGEPLEHEE
jgi:uncharacterized membrane protein YkoI